MRTSTRLRVAAATAGAISALAIVPGTAGAAFDAGHDAQCEGATTIAGRGASFQRQAQLAWGARMLAPSPGGPEAAGFGYTATALGGCSAFAIGGTQQVTYEPMGSGDGRKVFGAGSNGVRDTTIAFGGADEPPTTAQLKEANDGPDKQSGTADDAILHTVPVAQSSVAVVVKLPAGCTLAEANRTITRAALEGAFAGTASYDTWGDVVPGLAGAGCAAKPLKRVVRFDSSGTTFAFKGYLHAINPTGNGGQTWRALGNQTWPNDSGATATIRGTANGAGELLNTLSAQTTDGGIGYADLASARDKGYGWSGASDDTVWLKVQRSGSSYESPALSDTQSTTAAGSNCRTVTYKDPATGQLPTTTASWANVDGTGTATDYPLCALTYAMVWEDMAAANVGSVAPSLYTQGQARAVRDYLGYILNPASGQAALAPAGYQTLPSVDGVTGQPVAGSVLAAATSVLGKLTWAGQPVVDPGTDPGTDSGTNPGTDPGTNPGPGPGVNPNPNPNPNPTPNPTPVITPAAASVSIASVKSAKASKLSLSVSPSAAGRITVRGTAKSGKKTVAVLNGKASARKSGRTAVSLKLTSAGRRALKAGKSVKVTFRVTFTPNGGKAVTRTKTVSVKVKR